MSWSDDWWRYGFWMADDREAHWSEEPQPEGPGLGVERFEIHRAVAVPLAGALAEGGVQQGGRDAVTAVRGADEGVRDGRCGRRSDDVAGSLDAGFEAEETDGPIAGRRSPVAVPSVWCVWCAYRRGTDWSERPFSVRASNWVCTVVSARVASIAADTVSARS